MAELAILFLLPLQIGKLSHKKMFLQAVLLLLLTAGLRMLGSASWSVGVSCNYLPVTRRGRPISWSARHFITAPDNCLKLPSHTPLSHYWLTVIILPTASCRKDARWVRYGSINMLNDIRFLCKHLNLFNTIKSFRIYLNYYPEYFEYEFVNPS